MTPHRWSVAFIALVMGAIGMGISPIFVRLTDVGPFASAFWRLAYALPILIAWAYWERPDKSLNTSPTSFWHFSRPVLYSGIFFSGDLFFWHLAILKTSIANATLLACLSPVWVAILSPLYISERLSRLAAVGLGLCLIGAFLLISDENFLPFATAHWQGDLYALITGIFFAFYFLNISISRRTEDTGKVAFKSTLVSAIILLFITIISGQSLVSHTAIGLASLIALGVLSQAGGQGLMVFSLGILPSLFSSLVIFLEVLAAVILAWIIFGEALTTVQLIGGAIILSGIVVARPRNS